MGTWPTVVDLSGLGMSVRGLPVISASQEIMRCYGSTPDELIEYVEEVFSGSEWAEIGVELQSVGRGSVETRLRPWGDARAWHLDFFPASWTEHPYDRVPAGRRAEVAAYVDTVASILDGRLRESDLRAVAAEGGAAAVDRLVRGRVERLDQRHAALDALHGSLVDESLRLPRWALDFMLCEVETLNADREWLGAAVVAYHHGSAGRRPENVFGGVSFVFTAGAVDLARGHRAHTPGSGPAALEQLVRDAEAKEAGLRACPDGGA
ncbi:hypothetical protein [Streptomyces sp. NPDC023588]|uniref:hypothetical protein n=1 Tax=Streptomyces sp. NPDC023588 TaxID=3154907 RepID=UPI003410CCC0